MQLSSIHTNHYHLVNNWQGSIDDYANAGAYAIERCGNDDMLAKFRKRHKPS